MCTLFQHSFQLIVQVAPSNPTLRVLCLVPVMRLDIVDLRIKEHLSYTEKLRGMNERFPPTVFTLPRIGF